MSAFKDRRVFLCRPDDPRLAIGNAPSVGHSERSANGPLLVVLGRDADDFACGMLAHNLGIDKTVVIRFRDGDAASIEVRATKAMMSYDECLEALVKCKYYDRAPDLPRMARGLRDFPDLNALVAAWAEQVRCA